MTNLCNETPGIESLGNPADTLPAKPEPQVKYLNFEDVIEELNKKGTKLFRKVFKIDEKDYDTIYKIIVYFYKDVVHARELDIDLLKGLLLVGPVGCGKTSLMKLLLHMDIAPSLYHIVSVRDVCMQFTEKGFPVIKEYGASGQKQAPVFCFDDLGCEPSTRYYGIKANVMSEILLSRYELFMQRRVPTHITTNLSASELESMYGSRVRSRLREMSNLVSFPEDSYDKRR